MEHWLDNYIYGKNLTDEELRFMHLYPLKMFAYQMDNYNNYESIKGRLALLQLSLWKGAMFKDVCHVLNHIGLTRWQ